MKNKGPLELKSRSLALVPISAVLITGLLVFYLQSANAGNRVSLESTETITPLIELYTSEGCSSCPPADRFLSKLGEVIDKNFRAVPLAFHVDYWNRLGWTDPFSKKQYTERQKLIADLNKQKSIYTPQWVVTGKESRGGGSIYDLVSKRNSQKATVSIMLDVVAPSENTLQADIEIHTLEKGAQPEVYISLYENGIVRQIKRGENAGKTLKHDFVVRHWSKPVFIKDEQWMESFSLDIDPVWQNQNLGIAVVVIDPGNGETLQAVNGSLASLYPES